MSPAEVMSRADEEARLWLITFFSIVARLSVVKGDWGLDIRGA